MIDLAESRDQLDVADAAAALLTGRAVGSADLWDLCVEQGWFGLTLPEAAGGAGYGATEQVMVFREIGRALPRGPFLGTTYAAAVAEAAGAADLVHDLLGGAPALLAERSAGIADAWVVWNEVDDAEFVLLAEPDGRAAVVERSAVRVERRAQTLDDNVTLEVVGVEPGRGVRIDAALGRSIRRQMHLCAAALLTGICEGTRDMSAAYGRDRQQYGRPIGSFQAVKHRCADMAVRAEAAWAITALATVGHVSGSPEADFDAASARIVAGRSALANARDNIQNHGAIGFTREHDAHRFVKRAQLLAVTLGSPSEHLSVLRDATNPWSS